jgi:hypothetical protein
LGQDGRLVGRRLFPCFCFSVPRIGDASRLKTFRKKLCEKVLGVDCTETESQ